MCSLYYLVAMETHCYVFSMKNGIPLNAYHRVLYSTLCLRNKWAERGRMSFLKCVNEDPGCHMTRGKGHLYKSLAPRWIYFGNLFDAVGSLPFGLY